MAAWKVGDRVEEVSVRCGAECGPVVGAGEHSGDEGRTGPPPGEEVVGGVPDDGDVANIGDAQAQGGGEDEVGVRATPPP